MWPLSGLLIKIKGQIGTLESVQKLSLQVCFRNWDTNYHTLLSTNNIPSLSKRRLVLRLRPYKLNNRFLVQGNQTRHKALFFFFQNLPLEKSISMIKKMSSTSIVQHLTVYKTEPRHSLLRLLVVPNSN